MTLTSSSSSSSQSADSLDQTSFPTRTDPIYAQLGSRSATLLSLSDYDALHEGWRPWHILRRKGHMAREILRSANDRSWTECRRAINLIPLHFRDKDEEAAFNDQLNELNAPIGWLVVFPLPILLIACVASFQASRLSRSPSEIIAFVIAFATTTLSTILAGLTINRIALSRRHREVSYYAWMTLACWILQAYTIYVLSVRDTNEDELERFYLELWIRSICMAFELIPVLHADALICSNSTNSFFFHIAVLGGGLFSRIFRGGSLKHNRWQPFALDSIVFTLLFFISWSASWYRELRYKCTFHLQVLARVSVSRAREYAKRSQSSSIAEEMMNIIRNCQAAVSDRGISKSARRIITLLKECELALSGAATAPSASGFRSIYGARHNTKKYTNVRFSQQVATTKVFSIDEAPVAILKDPSSSSDDKTDPAAAAMIGISLDIPCFDFELVCVTLINRHSAQLKLRHGAIMTFAKTLDSFCCDTLPYHNANRIAQTAHAMSCFMIITRLKHYSSHSEMIGRTLASFTFNLGHSGRDNAYYQKSNSVLALATNDSSILQSLSCALMLQTTSRLGLIANLERNDQTRVRKHVIELVISTDDSSNFLSRFRFRKPNFDILTNQSDRTLLSELCLRLAQYSHEALPWDLYLDWVYRYYAEVSFTTYNRHEPGNTESPFKKIDEHLQSVTMPMSTTIVLVMAVELDDVCNSQECADFLANIQKNAVNWKARTRDFERDSCYAAMGWALPHPRWPVECLEKVLLKKCQ